MEQQPYTSVDDVVETPAIDLQINPAQTLTAPIIRRRRSRSRPAPAVDRLEPFGLRKALLYYDRLITVDELAYILCIAPGTVYSMTRNGSLPYFRIPGCNKIQFEPATILAWAERQQITHSTSRKGKW